MEATGVTVMGVPSASVKVPWVSWLNIAPVSITENAVPSAVVPPF